MHERRGLLKLTGPQAIWFLQQTVTADVDELPDGRWVESFFLTPKGKVVSHFRVGLLAEEVFVDIDPPYEALADWLVRYRFRTKVEIEDVTGEQAVVLGEEVAAPNTLVRTDSGALVFGDALGEVSLAIVHGEDASLTAADPAAVELARIEAGVPKFGVDYTTDNLPQEAGGTKAVPIDKGCYVGQETVARIHFRGHINKVARPISFESDSADGLVGQDVRLDDDRIGVVTSAASSPSRGVVGIGMISVAPAAGERVTLGSGVYAVLGEVPQGTKTKK